MSLQSTGWGSYKPYIVPPVAAAVAIFPPFFDFVAKSALQLEKPVPPKLFGVGLREGIKIAPYVGLLVGTQMQVEAFFKNRLFGDKERRPFQEVVATSALTGFCSSWLVAIFNGGTMGQSPLESLRGFTFRQCRWITLQESAFVAGVAAAEPLALRMKEQWGDHPAVEAAAVFGSGALGSFLGHPANTVLTRAQGGLSSPSGTQYFLGSVRKARGTGLFALGYYYTKQYLS